MDLGVGPAGASDCTLLVNEGRGQPLSLAPHAGDVGDILQHTSETRTHKSRRAHHAASGVTLVATRAHTPSFRFQSSPAPSTVQGSTKPCTRNPISTPSPTSTLNPQLSTPSPQTQTKAPVRRTNGRFAMSELFGQILGLGALPSPPLLRHRRRRGVPEVDQFPGRRAGGRSWCGVWG